MRMSFRAFIAFAVGLLLLGGGAYIALMPPPPVTPHGLPSQGGPQQLPPSDSDAARTAQIQQILGALRTEWRPTAIAEAADLLVASHRASALSVRDLLRWAQDPSLGDVPRAVCLLVGMLLLPEPDRQSESTRAMERADRLAGIIGLVVTGVTETETETETVRDQVRQVICHPLVVHRLWLLNADETNLETKAEVRQVLRGLADRPRARLLLAPAGALEETVLAFLGRLADPVLVADLARYELLNLESSRTRAWLASSCNQPWADIALKRTAYSSWAMTPPAERREHLARVLQSPDASEAERVEAVTLLGDPARWEGIDAPIDVIAPWLSAEVPGGSRELALRVAGTLVAYNSDASISLVVRSYDRLGPHAYTLLARLRGGGSALIAKGQLIERVIGDMDSACRREGISAAVRVLPPSSAEPLLIRAREKEADAGVLVLIDEAIAKVRGH